MSPKVDDRGPGGPCPDPRIIDAEVVSMIHTSFPGWFPRTGGLLAAMAALLACNAPSPGLVVPPPLSESQLLEQSTLVVTADVLGVACTGKTRSGQPTYTAWLQVIESRKGAAAPPSTLQFAWTATDPNLLGSWSYTFTPATA
jgi:hypothetical protein